uniref:Glycosyltransferase family 92 protein n=1 Tax=Angiostrongylus cantonensis TaxID=6313 RepID=A0A0K0DN19_ANGCA
MKSFNRNTIYCRYFDQQRSEIVPPFKTVVFPEFTALCLRREGVKHISLSDAPTGYYEYPVNIPVTTHYFSACLAPLYGMEPKWLLLAEFIEHHKIQGVTHFYIYVNELDEYSWILLDNYVRSGEAEVIAFLDYFSRDDRLSQLLQLQECLTRSRGHSQWVAMVDLDERLTPTEYRGTLSDFLQTIFNETIAELSFRQQFILRNETLPQKYISKSQVGENLSKCYNSNKKVVLSLLKYSFRHYRDIHRGNWKERWLSDVEEFGEFSITDYPAKHMNTLRENVQQRLHSAYVGMH